jgi:hypothetical protein
MDTLFLFLIIISSIHPSSLPVTTTLPSKRDVGWDWLICGGRGTMGGKGEGREFRVLLMCRGAMST